MSDEAAFSEVQVRSLVSHKTREPRVEVHWKDSAQLQMTPDETRALALNLINAAEAAEQDAFMVWFAEKRVGAKERDAGAILSEFRDWRENRYPKAS